MNAAAVRPRMCRTSRMLPTVLLLALLGAVVLLGACSGDETQTTAGSNGGSSSGETWPTVPGQTGETGGTSGDGTLGGAQAGDWGPVPLAPGSLEQLTIANGIGIGRIVQNVGKRNEQTYVYVLDVGSGTITATTEIPGRIDAVDIGKRYVFIWAKDGIRVYKPGQSFVYVQTLDNHFVSDFGSYFYVEDPTGPDYLINKGNLQQVTLQAAFQTDRVTDDRIYALLYPDCVVGDSFAFEGESSDKSTVYSLAEHAVIGHIPPDIRIGSEIAAWDPQGRLLFGISGHGISSVEDKLFVYSLGQDKMLAESVLKEGDSVGENLGKGGSVEYVGVGDRLHVIADIRPTVDGWYVINGSKRWYGVEPSGAIHNVQSGSEIVGQHVSAVLAYNSENRALESGAVDGGIAWTSAVPSFFGTHPDGPYAASSSIAWVNSCSGLRGHGDVVSQWDYATGSSLGYTEFTGYEAQVLSADPFIMALRDRSEGVDGTWVLGGGDATRLPTNLVVDLGVKYEPHDIHAKTTLVTFTCTASRIPESFQGEISYEWDIAGVKATGSQVTYTFPAAGTFTVTVTARAGASVSTATKSVEVKVRDPLVPDGFKPSITPDFYTAEGLSFRFECRGLSSEVAKIAWDFGDGTTGTGPNITHEYPLGGYDATCRLYDKNGTLLYEHTENVHSSYPSFTAYVSPRDGYAPVAVSGSCQVDSGYTDDGLHYSWYVSEEQTTTTTAAQQPFRFSEVNSFSRTFTTAGSYLIALEITDPAGQVLHAESFTIVASPIRFTMSDGGRTMESDLSMWADGRGDAVGDPDKDGLLQIWENAAIEQVNPIFELDEGEDLLVNPKHKCVNFVRVAPWPDGADYQTAEYVIFYFAVSYTKDYGRLVDVALTQGHNGDMERVTMVWQCIDPNTLKLAYVYTAAHSANFHGGVWDANRQTTNIGIVTDVLGKPFAEDVMTANLEFKDNRLKLYTSEDKHANYPSLEVGEKARLVWVGDVMIGVGTAVAGPFGLLLGLGASAESGLAEALGAEEYSTAYVQEDVGGGPEKKWPCYNVGEPAGDPNLPGYDPGRQLIDDIGPLFKNERVWSGNKLRPDCFAGGLEPQVKSAVTLGSPGPISNGFSMPDRLLKVLTHGAS